MIDQGRVPGRRGELHDLEPLARGEHPMPEAGWLEHGDRPRGTRTPAPGPGRPAPLHPTGSRSAGAAAGGGGRDRRPDRLWPRGCGWRSIGRRVATVAGRGRAGPRDRGGTVSRQGGCGRRRARQAGCAALSVRSPRRPARLARRAGLAASVPRAGMTSSVPPRCARSSVRRSPWPVIRASAGSSAGAISSRRNPRRSRNSMVASSGSAGTRTFSGCRHAFLDPCERQPDTRWVEANLAGWERCTGH